MRMLLMASIFLFPAAAMAQTDTNGGAASMPAHRDQMTALGEIICDQDPYIKLPPDQVTGHTTGTMEIMTQPAIAESDGIVSRVEVNNLSYGKKIEVGGQQVYAKKTIAIPYRYPELDKDGKIVAYHTDRLIVIYAGSEGGG